MVVDAKPKEKHETKDVACPNGITQISFFTDANEIRQISIQCSGATTVVGEPRDGFEVPPTPMARWLLSRPSNKGTIGDIWFTDNDPRHNMLGKGSLAAVKADTIVGAKVRVRKWSHKPFLRDRRFYGIVETVWVTLKNGKVIKMPPNGPGGPAG